ncbi:hypothetical protein PHMEG_00023785 [Phytophthora megakarya]|uniref:Uncharacterized protein n=1 Tax=Phytophthora megakarya TaxID=4795 RepID=A0A225VII4_9STRA|nr:hypothetical protein PHMEG_00023785 [Phytophthora megakarya]
MDKPLSKPEYFVRTGEIIVFESEALQRRRRDKTEQLIKETGDSQSVNNARIAQKILKYRGLSPAPIG